MSDQTDHFNELSSLLFGAKERYRTACATVRHRRRGAPATEAYNRFVDYRFPRGGLKGIGLPDDVPPYRELEDLEEVSRLWHERPDRWRQETDLPDGTGTVYRVADGKGPWWFYRPPDQADYSPTNRGEFSPDEDLACFLDPSRIYHSLDDCTLRIVGHGIAGMIGREAIEVEARAISWDYPPSSPFMEGADDYRLSVDTEVGVILRLAARLWGEEFDAIEVLEIAFDESFPEGTFVLELPGVEFRRVDH